MRRHYPRGKLRADDDGAVEMRFAIQDGVLIIAFPHPTEWVGLPPAEVEGLIAILQEKLAVLKATGA